MFRAVPAEHATEPEAKREQRADRRIRAEDLAGRDLRPDVAEGPPRAPARQIDDAHVLERHVPEGGVHVEGQRSELRDVYTHGGSRRLDC